MAYKIEALVGELKYDVNRKELQKAKGDVDKLKAASKMLEDEQKKTSRTTQDLRENLQDLRIALSKGIIEKSTFRKRTNETRLALADEANAARRTTAALKELKMAERDAAKAQRESAKAAQDAARAYDRAQGAAFGGRLRSGPRRVGPGGLGGDDSPYSAKKRPSIGRRVREGGSFLGAVAGNAGGNLASAGISAVLHGIGDAFRSIFDQSKDFESAMADVAKVVDGLKTPAGVTTAAYAKLSDELKTLSTRIAVTPVGLANMAAAAGQAGIAGAELSRFVEDAAKTMVAFDITSDEAGNGLAKLRANLGIGQDAVMELAGTMNHLSNNMASTAAEVLDASLRIGAVGKAANMSGQEVAGLASSMIAAGATSEIAATATKNFILAMASGEAATKRQREAFSKLGLSSTDVAKEFSGSAEQRIAITRKLFERLGKLRNDQRASTTMQLFGRESLGPIASLTTNIEGYDRAMALALDKTAAMGSVQKEFDVRSKTTANTWQLLKNRISVVAIEIGDGMAPALNEVMKEMGEFITGSRNAGKTLGETLGEGIRRVWQYLKELIGPMDELPGKLKSAIDTAAAFASGLMSVVGALTTVVGALGGTETAILGIGLALTAATGPWGIMAAAAVVAISLIERSLAKLIPEIPLLGDQLLGLRDRLTTPLVEELNKQGLDKLRGNDDPAAGQGAAMAAASSFGRARGIVDSTESRESQQPALKKPKTFADAARAQVQDKMARFKWLDRNRKRLTPSQVKEWNTLSKELDVRKSSGSGKAPKRSKDDISGFEQSLEGEIDKLSKEAGTRAGIKAASEGRSRAEQYKASMAAQKSTQKTLQARVDAGGTLPGTFHRNLLDSAGFSDVAGRGQPPPIAVSIVKVEAPQVDIKFTGPISGDPRELRENINRVFREMVPEALAAGIREAKTPVIY